VIDPWPATSWLPDGIRATVPKPAGLDAGLPPVAVVADEERVALRQRRFEEIWEAAERL
jgi:hypothetical protein